MPIARIFIAEAYLKTKEIVREVRPYGIGVVIDQKDLIPAIANNRICGSIVTDQNLRVVENE